MGLLKIGRVGMDATITITDPIQGIGHSSFDANQTVTLSGIITTTVAYRKILRGELVAQTGRLVAVTYDADSDIDGFYILRNADIRATTDNVAYNSNGSFPFTVTLDRVGSESETQIQSLITGTVLTNQHGLIASETAPFHAPAVGHLAYDSKTGTPTQRTRTGSEGDVDWYDGIDDTIDPTWSVAPSGFYTGSTRILVSGVLRAGTDAPNDVDDFELSNTLVKVTPGTTTGVSDGRINIAFYDGTQWDAPFKFKIVYDPAGGANVIPAWHYFTIIRNDPEVSIVRLMRDAAPATSAHHHTLDIGLRRGSRFAWFVYNFTGAAATYDVIRDSNDAATAFTPTGATSAVGVLDDTATDGNKFVVATSETHTARTTEGGIRVTGPQFDFMLGAEVGATPGTGNDADSLALQYFGWVAERDRATRR